jgi:hypothetical protein
LIGVVIILYGFIDMKQENNILQFLFGIPIAAGAFGLHVVVRRIARDNTLHIWVAESVLVALMAYGFLHS